MTKLAIIGLDGATWDLINPWIAAGILPTFKRLVYRGSTANLCSTIPPHSGPAWTSCITGVNPGKHNIFSFSKRIGRRRQQVTSRDRAASPIWRFVGAASLASIVVNVPLTYPPDEMKDLIIVGGFGTPSQKSRFTHPEHLASQLIRKGYSVDLPSANNMKDALPMLLKVEQRRKDLILQLMEDYHWDLMMVVFTLIDRVQHFLWKIGDEPDSNSQNMKLLKETYVQMDQIVGAILESLDETCDVFVISDHGAGPTQRAVCINEWLRRERLLLPRKSLRRSTLRRLGITRSSIFPLVRSLKFMAPSRVRRIAKQTIPPPDLHGGDIDWSGTKAWLCEEIGQALCLNASAITLIHNGDSEGDQRDHVRNHIIRYLSQLEDPSNGAKIFTGVYPRESVLWGPCVENAPDILFELAEGYRPSERFGADVVVPADYAWHRRYGIFLAIGQDFKRGYRIPEAHITDITPTALHILGLQIPSYMDGRVIEQIFCEGSEPSKKVTYSDYSNERGRISLTVEALSAMGKF